MRFAAVVFAAFGLHAPSSAADPVLKPAPIKAGFPKFDVQEIATDLSIGYAVVAADIDGDGKPDIVVVDKHRVVWYQNPTWKMRTILTGKTRPDNVCITAFDLDGSGDVELVVGAGWKPFDTTTPGTLQWLKRGKTLDDEWTLHAIPCDEPMVHRVAVTAIDGKPHVVMAPLMGRGATAKGNWTDGRPCRILAYPVPADPVKGPWVPTVLNEDLHVVHNVTFYGTDLFTASYEGVTQLRRDGAVWEKVAEPVRPGNQANRGSSRGSSEVAVQWAEDNLGLGPIRVAAVEPWHGNQIVVYESGQREVIDDHLRWGHAVKFLLPASLGTSMIVAGVRDDPNPKAGDTFTERRGVRLYKRGFHAKWERHIIDDGGVAVEDLVVADLNGDGRPDIVAVGRATGNCRIYWNRGE